MCNDNSHFLAYGQPIFLIFYLNIAIIILPFGLQPMMYLEWHTVLILFSPLPFSALAISLMNSDIFISCILLFCLRKLDHLSREAVCHRLKFKKKFLISSNKSYAKYNIYFVLNFWCVRLFTFKNKRSIRFAIQRSFIISVNTSISFWRLPHM